MLKTLRENYDADHEILILYERQKNRIDSVLNAVINAQKQIRVSRQTLNVSQKLAIDLQMKIDDLTKQLTNQQNANILIEVRQQRQNLILSSSSSSSNVSIIEITSASISTIVDASVKRSIKHLDLDKFIEDSNERDHVESVFDD